MRTAHATRPPARIPRAPAPTQHRPITAHHPSPQARVHTECDSCQAVNGVLPADGSGCSGHGTHVASTVGGLKHGVAKEVTIVPAFSCFMFRCSDGSYRCGSMADITANLECAPSALAPAFIVPPCLLCSEPTLLRATALVPPPPSQPRSHSGARPPQRPPRPRCAAQVGAHRLRSAPRSALRSDLGYTQSRHPSRHVSTPDYG